MIVLSNGYKLPETGDFGDVWFPALEDNITRVNSHNHDGSNSEKLSSINIASVVQTVLAGTFSASGDEFRSLVSLAGGAVEVDSNHVAFRDPTTKEPIYMRYEKETLTSIYVYTNIVRDIEVVIL